MEYDIQIRLRTTITDEGTNETTVVEAQGKLHSKENGDLISYDEKIGDENKASVKNVITIQAEKVSIRRTGAVKMNQVFQKGKRSESVFQHPHGRMHMETFTESIDYDPFNENKPGKLTINYTVKLNGQEARHHFLELILEN